jgi:hypothetical protein
MSTTYLKAGNLLPALEATLRDDDGDAVDLTAATGVRLHMRQAFPPRGVVVDAAASVVVAASGIVSYSWQAGDTDEIGTHYLEWEVTWAGGVETFPKSGYDRVVIVEAIA